MRVKEEHPHQLLWYVSGAIGARERQEVDRHLRECEECREEVVSLASMMRSVRIQSRMDHMAAADLALYEEEPRSLDDSRRAAVEGHLTECAECRDDLRTLRLAREREAAPSATGQVSGRSRMVRGFGIAATAAAVVLGALTLWPLRFGPPITEVPPPGVRSVIFPAPRRGAEIPRSLRGSGPWTLRVLLPFGAKPGNYRVDFRLPGGGVLPTLTTAALTDPDLCLTVALRGLPGPGRYEMILRRDPEDAGEPIVYPFDLLPPAGPGPEP